MMAQDGSESIWEPINYRKFISQFWPDIITSIWQLEQIKIKICGQKTSIQFNQISLNKEMLHTCTHTYMYVYIRCASKFSAKAELEPEYRVANQFFTRNLCM